MINLWKNVKKWPFFKKTAPYKARREHIFYYLIATITVFISILIVSGVDMTLYDDFDDGVLNPSLWVNGTGGAGNIVFESGGYLNFSYSNNNGYARVTLNFSDMGGNVTFYLKKSGVGSNDVCFFNDTMTGCENDELLRFNNGGDDDSNFTISLVNTTAFTVYKGATLNGTFNLPKLGSQLQNATLAFKTAGGAGPTIEYHIDFLYYGDPPGHTISLNSPVNNFDNPNRSVTFNCSSSDAGGNNIVNISLYLDNNRNKTVTGATTSLELHETITNVAFGSHEWNCLSTSATNDRQWGDTNRTFDVVNLSFSNLVYSNTTTEGNSETFTANVSTNGLQISTATLQYNNTDYSGTITDNGGNVFTVTRVLDIPTIGADSNITFFWKVLLQNSQQFNSTATNQTVNDLALDDCAVNTFLILNYSLKDEETQEFLAEDATINSSVEVDVDVFPLGSTTPVIEFSQNYSNENNPQVCLGSDLSGINYTIDVQTRYTGAGYASEFNHLQQFALNNDSVPQNIDLLDLKSTDSTEFLITYKDNAFFPVEDALISITRKYVDEGVFKTVEIPKTDESGQTKGHFDLDGVIYTIVVSQNGTTVATFNEVTVRCENPVTSDCNLNLNAFTGGTEFTDWANKDDLNYNFVFDSTLRRITVTFNTVSGGTSVMFLNTTKYDRFGNNTVCSDTLTSSTGTLTCDIPASFGNTTVISTLYKDWELITTRDFTIEQDMSETFQGTRFVLMLILVITFPLMFITDRVGMIIGVILGLITSSLLFLYNGGSYIGPVSVLVWFIVAGGIIIWKMTR